MRYFFSGWLLLTCAALFAQQPDTWPVIQEQIINPKCTICHFSGSTFARQSGLVLTADSAYQELTQELPHNTAARNDGLVRLSRTGGLPGIEQSFIWEKINAPNQEHFYNDHPNYGSLMPLGLPALTNGQLAFIEAWIAAGSPDQGAVADTALLQDTSSYAPPPFVALNPPAQGFQLHLGPYSVWNSALHDREFLYFDPYQTTEDLYISRYEIAYRPGSHHFILYNYPDGKSAPAPQIYRDLRNEQGQIDFLVALQLGNLFPFAFFIGSQTPLVNYAFQPGVALRLPAGSGFDFNVHSVNRGDSAIIGEVYVNMHTVDFSEVQHVADYDNFGNFNFTLPPNQVTTISKTFTFSEQRHIISMWSHAHEHMTQFRIEGVGGAHDGELLYWTNDWAHPPTLELDPPLTFEAGDQIKLVTTYNNWTNNWINYGPLSTDEMQFVFYIYYTGQVTGLDHDAPQTAVESFSLAQNYPNPFNPTTLISYTIGTRQLPATGNVTLTIYDLLGRKTKTLVNESKSAGKYSVTWDGRDAMGNPMSSGIYIYRLQAGNYVQNRKMLLIR